MEKREYIIIGSNSYFQKLKFTKILRKLYKYSNSLTVPPNESGNYNPTIDFLNKIAYAVGKELKVSMG